MPHAQYTHNTARLCKNAPKSASSRADDSASIGRGGGPAKRGHREDVTLAIWRCPGVSPARICLSPGLGCRALHFSRSIAVRPPRARAVSSRRRKFARVLRGYLSISTLYIILSALIHPRCVYKKIKIKNKHKKHAAHCVHDNVAKHGNRLASGVAKSNWQHTHKVFG